MPEHRSQDAPEPRKRWGRRFSLRTLLVVTTLLAVGLWYGKLAERARRQREAVAWVTVDFKSYVTYDYEYSENGDHPPNAAPPGPAWLRELIGVDMLADVVGVTLCYQGVTELTSLEDLPELRVVGVIGHDVPDFTPLTKLKKLWRLALDHTHISDEQLAMLRRALPGCRITSATDSRMDGW